MNRKCEDCRNDRPIVARGLCLICYNRHRSDGTIDSFPTIPERARSLKYECRCAYPLVERLRVFGTAQCLRCGRKMTDERIEELGL